MTGLALNSGLGLHRSSLLGLVNLNLVDTSSLTNVDAPTSAADLYGGIDTDVHVVSTAPPASPPALLYYQTGAATVGEDYTMSAILVKVNAADGYAIRLYSTEFGSDKYVFFNLTDGTIDANADGLTTHVEDIGRGRWEIGITDTATSGGTNLQMQIIPQTGGALINADTIGAGNEAFIIYDAKIEVGTNPTRATIPAFNVAQLHLSAADYEFRGAYDIPTQTFTCDTAGIVYWSLDLTLNRILLNEPYNLTYDIEVFDTDGTTPISETLTIRTATDSNLATDTVTQFTGAGSSFSGTVEITTSKEREHIGFYLDGLTVGQKVKINDFTLRPIGININDNPGADYEAGWVAGRYSPDLAVVSGEFSVTGTGTSFASGSFAIPTVISQGYVVKGSAVTTGSSAFLLKSDAAQDWSVERGDISSPPGGGATGPSEVTGNFVATASTSHIHTLTSGATATKLWDNIHVHLSVDPIFNAELQRVASGEIAGWDKTTAGLGDFTVDGEITLNNIATTGAVYNYGSNLIDRTKNYVFRFDYENSTYTDGSGFAVYALDKSGTLLEDLSNGAVFGFDQGTDSTVTVYVPANTVDEDYVIGFYVLGTSTGVCEITNIEQPYELDVTQIPDADGVSIIPDMTANFDQGFTLSSDNEFSTSFSLWRAFGTGSNYFLSSAFSAPYTVGMNLDNVYAVQSYTVQDSNSDVTRSPKAWTLEGSNDNGTTWTIVDTVTGQDDWTLDEIKTFTVDTPGWFKEYRFEITENNGHATQVGFKEVELRT